MQSVQQACKGLPYGLSPVTSKLQASSRKVVSASLGTLGLASPERFFRSRLQLEALPLLQRLDLFSPSPRGKR